VLRALAERLGVEGFWSFGGETGAIDAILDHPSTGHATVAALAEEGGIRALEISHVGHPGLVFPTPSGRLELRSDRAAALGLPPLPEPGRRGDQGGIELRFGRTLEHFHGFYDHGRALPTLAARGGGRLWIAPSDAEARGIDDGDRVDVSNEHGASRLEAHVTAKVPAGVAWIRTGVEGANRLTDGNACLPDGAVDLFSFSAGQAAYGTTIEIAAARDDRTA
jgi:anaerobic selenocysteine-containing dehydrogenase